MYLKGCNIKRKIYTFANEVWREGVCKKRQLQIRKSLIAAVLIFALLTIISSADTCRVKAYGGMMDVRQSGGMENGIFDDAEHTEDIQMKRCRKACWISYLDFQTYLKDKTLSGFTEAVSGMYDRLCAYGIDTVIVQVRPMGDAIYPSEYFPVSVYISGSRTLPGYDPLRIMIDEAHKRGMMFEAWVNPYRLSRSDETTEDYKGLWAYEMYGEFIYSYTNPDGEECLSLEPSDKRSIELIVAGVREIVQNYDVDGIHFDDYFYVDGMHDGTSIQEKKSYVNSMISQVYETVKECNSDCTFGVSPAGNMDAARNQGADIDRWLSTPGYVDYIMPQIYWTDYYETSEGTVTMFSDMAKSWQDVNALDLPIYVGLALYRVGESSVTDMGWGTYSDNLARGWQTAFYLGYDGYTLFRYEWFELDVASEELENLRQVSCASDTEKIKLVIDEITRVAVGYSLGNH